MVRRFRVGEWAIQRPSVPCLILATTGWSDSGYGPIPFGIGLAVAVNHGYRWEPRVLPPERVWTFDEAIAYFEELADERAKSAEQDKRWAEEYRSRAQILRDPAAAIRNQAGG